MCGKQVIVVCVLVLLVKGGLRVARVCSSSHQFRYDPRTRIGDPMRGRGGEGIAGSQQISTVQCTSRDMEPK
jgi:hypothetical protein